MLQLIAQYPRIQRLETVVIDLTQEQPEPPLPHRRRVIDLESTSVADVIVLD